MLAIRLSRTGKKSQPSFRVVLQEHTASAKGKFLEILGHYRPTENPKTFVIKEDRVKHWLSVGARPSDTMAVLLKGAGLEGMEKFIEPRDKKRKSKKETPKEEVKAQPAAPKEESKAEEAPVETPAEEPKVEEAPKTEEKSE